MQVELRLAVSRLDWIEMSPYLRAAFAFCVDLVPATFADPICYLFVKKRPSKLRSRRLPQPRQTGGIPEERVDGPILLHGYSFMPNENLS
jgi:hypothetical protein